MKPVIGPANQIIEQALRLGILCRPTRGIRVGVGEALELTEDGFYRVSASDEVAVPYSPSPVELICDWELTSWDLIRSEYRREVETPW